MLKQLKKKKPKIPSFQSSATTQVTCGACTYVRKQSDRCPDWQCPGCGKAYNKTNPTPEAVKQQKQEARERYKQHSEKAKQKEMQANVIYGGLMTGAITFTQGLARTVGSCAQPLVKTAVAANPFLQVAGLAIIAASLAYAVYKFLL